VHILVIVGSTSSFSLTATLPVQDVSSGVQTHLGAGHIYTLDPGIQVLGFVMDTGVHFKRKTKCA